MGGQTDVRQLAAILSATELRIRGVNVYKVIAGRGATIASYNDIRGAQYHDDLDGDGSLQHLDWQGLYMQFTRDHVLGTVPYRWERGCREASLIAVTFDEIDVVVLNGPLLHDGYVDGRIKAAAAKELLGIKPTKSLMAALAEQRKLALVRETAEEWELIVPHALLSRLKFSERRVASFQRHPKRPITHRWCPDGSESWQRWDDDLCPTCIPDLDMSWML